MTNTTENTVRATLLNRELDAAAAQNLARPIRGRLIRALTAVRDALTRLIARLTYAP